MDMYVHNLGNACFSVIPVQSTVLGVLSSLNNCISLSAIIVMLFQVSSVYSCQYSYRQLVYGAIC